MYLDRRIVLALGLILAAACSRKDTDAANAQDVGDTIGTAKRLIVIPTPASPYRVTTVTDSGNVTGTVTFDGTPKGDTLIQIAADQNGCAKPLTITRLQRTNGKVAGVVVWLTDVRAGRALPSDRRFELDNNDCTWDPIIQVVPTGGTLNVFNEDPLVERAYITSVSTGDTVGIAPFTDAGQIIPYDRLLRTPGVNEFSMESRPMSRAWVVALDHPYFAITKTDGRFTITGLPPGKHTIRAWHPMLGVADGTVQVTPGQTATVDLQFH